MPVLQTIAGIVASTDKTPDSVDWANVSGANPTQATTDESFDNFDGSIDVSIAYTGGGAVRYRIDSGSWTAYSSAFSVSDGETVGFDFTNFGADSGTATVTNDTTGDTIDTFTVTLT